MRDVFYFMGTKYYRVRRGTHSSRVDDIMSMLYEEYPLARNKIHHMRFQLEERIQRVDVLFFASLLSASTIASILSFYVPAAIYPISASMSNSDRFVGLLATVSGTVFILMSLGFLITLYFDDSAIYRIPEDIESEIFVYDLAARIKDKP